MSRLRSVLLASTILGATALASAPAAHAQMAVFDGASFGQLVQEAQNGANELTKLETQIQRLESLGTISQANYTQLTNFYNSFAHLDNVTQMAPLLSTSAVSFPLPELAQIESLLRGQGFSGSLASQAQTILTQIQRFTPTGTDFRATQINTSARATAGTMASAQTLYTAAQQRQQGIAQMMDGVATSTDPKQSLDLTARATLENGYAQTQANQAVALQVMQKAQEDAQVQQEDQAWRQGAESLASQATAAGSGS